jgi:signal peptidase I
VALTSALDEPGLRSDRLKRIARTAGKLTLELAALCLLALLFFLRVPQVNGHSMEPQLLAGDHVLIDTLAFDFRIGAAVDVRLHPLKRGEIVAFHHGDGDERESYVKRIVGLPGDAVSIVDGQVLVNSRALAEPYLSKRDRANVAEVAVPADSYFVLGDNRGESDDSRAFGPVPRSAIIGRADLIVWPFNRAGQIR